MFEGPYSQALCDTRIVVAYCGLLYCATMRARYVFPFALLLIPFIYVAQSSAPPEAMTFRVIFGEKDQSPTKWDGTITASGARVSRIDLWRSGENDSVNGVGGWKLSTAASAPGTDQRLGKIAPKGVVIT